MSCHQLFVLLCHSQQAVPALPQQLHSQRRLPGTRHARFLHPPSQTSSERAQELPTVPIFVTEKVHVGIERNRAIPTKWRTGSSRRRVGGSRHMVDWPTLCTVTFLWVLPVFIVSLLRFSSTCLFFFKSLENSHDHYFNPLTLFLTGHDLSFSFLSACYDNATQLYRNFRSSARVNIFSWEKKITIDVVSAVTEEL